MLVFVIFQCCLAVKPASPLEPISGIVWLQCFMLLIVTTLVKHSEVANGLGSIRPDILLFGDPKLAFGGLLSCDFVSMCVDSLLLFWLLGASCCANAPRAVGFSVVCCVSRLAPGNFVFSRIIPLWWRIWDICYACNVLVTLEAVAT